MCAATVTMEPASLQEVQGLQQSFGASLAFEDVGVTIPLPRRQDQPSTRVVLSDVTGFVPAGSMCAFHALCRGDVTDARSVALMGSSGAGKAS